MANKLTTVPGSWWGKVIGAGLVGGVAMAIYEMIAHAAIGMGFWMPLNGIATIVPAFRPPAPGFELAPAMTGAAVHMMTSAVWALVYGAAILLMVPRALSHYGIATVTGLVFGLVTYLVTGIGIGPLLAPALATAPPLHFFIGHLVFGLVTAYALAAWTSRREVSVTFAPETVAERERMRQ